MPSQALLDIQSKTIYAIALSVTFHILELAESCATEVKPLVQPCTM